MYSDDLFNKVLSYTNDERRARNITNTFMKVNPSFADVIEKWVYGAEPKYEYNGITLDIICQKERCSYFSALFRMAILLDNADLANGYLRWTPVNYDWGR
jgi:hypothetical protein